MLIETDRLQIRRRHPDDWPDLYEYLSLPEIYVYEPGGPISEADARKLARERAEGESFLPVLLKESGKMIGHLYFNRVAPEEFLTCELGYIFNLQYYGRGYATEASSCTTAQSRLKEHLATQKKNSRQYRNGIRISKVSICMVLLYAVELKSFCINL